MNKDKVQNQNILGTLVNKDESGIIAYSDQIYDKKADKSLEEENIKQDKRLDNAEAKDRELQSTLEGITKTGEASAASNVTYNHNDSQLDASNVQQAIDEVHKRSNYNDGENIIDFNTVHIIKDSSIWFLLLVDANDKFIFGISRKDGQPHWGIGIPKVVKDYVDKQINDILGTNNITETIDSLKEVEKFLVDFKNSDTLKALLDTKANKADVNTAITNINADIADKYKKSNPNDDEGNVVDTNALLGIKSNAPFFSIITDLVGKVLEAINLNGVHKFFAGIDIQGSLHFVTSNPKFIWMLVDSENKFIIGIDKETGSPRYGVGVPIQIKEYIDNVISNISADVLKQVNEVIARLSDRIMITDGVGGILFTDSNGKVLFTLGLNGENKSFLPLNVQGSSFKVMTNEHFFLILLDKDDKAVFYIDREGNVNWQKGVPKVVQDWVTKEIVNVNRYDPNDAYERNKGRIAALQNACQKLYQGSNKDFQLEIVTDSHADTRSVENAISFCNNFKTIDAIIHCGDIVGGNGWSERSYVTNTFIPLMKTCKKPWFICIGNHDVGNTSFVPWGVNHEDAYTMYIKPMIDSGILKEGEYQEGKCYYYHDITGYNQNIRLIVLYEYDQPLDVADTEYWKVIDYKSSYPQLKGGQYTYDANNPIRVNCGDYKEHSFELLQSVNVTYSQYASDKTQPYFRLYRGAEVIRQEQAEWFRDTLLSTPEGYGIIIATHNPFSRNAHNQVNYNFAINEELYGRNSGQYEMATDLIGDVANAYNERTSLEEKIIISSYSFHNGSYLNTNDDGDGTKYYYKLIADFTNAKANILGFVGGHSHQDLVFKNEDYNLWGINPTCAATNGNNAFGDVAKDSTDDLAYDSITVTSWNKNRLALCRIGNLYSTSGKVRDLEVIDTSK